MSHIKDVKSRREYDFCAILLWMVLFSEIVLIFVSNLFYLEKNLDLDNTTLFVHMIKMAEHRKFHIPNWNYQTCLEWDGVSMFGTFLYVLTHNVYVASAVANTLYALIYTATIFFLFRKENRILPLVISCFIMIPYRIGMLDYYNMMFFGGSWYMNRTLVPLLFIALVMWNEQEKSKQARYRSIVLSLFFAFLLWMASLSNGVHVGFVAIFPAMACYFIYKFCCCAKPDKYNVFLFAMSFFVILSGSAFFVKVMDGKMSTNMKVISIQNFWKNLDSCFGGIFELMGAVTEKKDISVMSVDGINAVLKFALVIGMFVCLFVAVRRQRSKATASLRDMMLMTVVFVNLFVLIVTNTRGGSETYEYRYHLIGMLALMCVSLTVVWKLVERGNAVQQRVCIAGIVCVLLFLEGVNYSVLFTGKDQVRDLREFVEYCSSNYDEFFVYMYDESDAGNICRFLSDSNRQLYLCVQDDATMWAYNFYDDFNGEILSSTDGILVLRSGKDIEPADEIKIGRYDLYKVDKFKNRTIYKFK